MKELMMFEVKESNAVTTQKIFTQKVEGKVVTCGLRLPLRPRQGFDRGTNPNGK